MGDSAHRDLRAEARVMAQRLNALHAAGALSWHARGGTGVVGGTPAIRGRTVRGMTLLTNLLYTRGKISNVNPCTTIPN